MIVTNDEALARRAKHLSTQVRPGDHYVHDEVGYYYPMTNINAALELAQLEGLDEMVAAKRQIARKYDKAIMERTDLTPMPGSDGLESSCWLYSVLADSRDDAENIVQHLNADNIGDRTFWHGLAKQKAFAGSKSLLDGMSEFLSGRVVSLPWCSSLTEKDPGRVIEAVFDWHNDQHS